MTIKEIYEAFDKIGCLSFSTINEDLEPVSRIAHLRGFDDKGIYFMTMFTKQFYKELKKTGKVSICGLAAPSNVSHDENGLPIFSRGYSIRLTGNVEEISIEDIKKKNNPIFDMCIKDQEKYPSMVVFCITSARGDIFDYDFELEARDHKLERTYFSFNQMKPNFKGLHIDDTKCIKCGKCFRACSFKAISKIDNTYVINKNRCDECGDCYLNCPVSAISYTK